MDPVALGALIRAKRGAKRLTQATLALDVFGDETRKGDISRIETGKVAPQEAAIQKLLTALDISEAELAPIRQSRPSAQQLANIPGLNREELQNLAARFDIEGAFDRSDTDLRAVLTEKAADYRRVMKEVAALRGLSDRIDNIHAAAMDTMQRLQLDEARQLLFDARDIHRQDQLLPALETNEKLMVAEADLELLDGNAEAAFTILTAATDGFASIDPIEPARRRILSYWAILRNHGLRFGGSGLDLSLHLLTPSLNDTLRNADAWLWAAGMNARALALQDQGTRTEGPAGANLLAKAVTAYRAALEVRTRADYPVDWATAQHNLGTALQSQGIRTDGPAGAGLLAQAVSAYLVALEVRTRTDHPMDWAMTQENIAIALISHAEYYSTADPRPDLTEALAAVTAALEVFDPVHMSYNHAKATRLRDRIQKTLDTLP